MLIRIFVSVLVLESLGFAIGSLPTIHEELPERGRENSGQMDDVIGRMQSSGAPNIHVGSEQKIYSGYLKSFKQLTDGVSLIRGDFKIIYVIHRNKGYLNIRNLKTSLVGSPSIVIPIKVDEYYPVRPTLMGDHLCVILKAKNNKAKNKIIFIHKGLDEDSLFYSKYEPICAKFHAASNQALVLWKKRDGNRAFISIFDVNKNLKIVEESQNINVDYHAEKLVVSKSKPHVFIFGLSKILQIINMQNFKKTKFLLDQYSTRTIRETQEGLEIIFLDNSIQKINYEQ